MSQVMDNWLYTYEYAGKAYDGDMEYKLVELVYWSDRTVDARQIGKKFVYFLGSIRDIRKILDSEQACKNFYTIAPDYSRWEIGKLSLIRLN